MVDDDIDDPDVYLMVQQKARERLLSDLERREYRKDIELAVSRALWPIAFTWFAVYGFVIWWRGGF